MRCVQLMALLLEENTLESLHTSVEHKQSNIVVSEAFVELAPVSFLDGLNCVCFTLQIFTREILVQTAEMSC